MENVQFSEHSSHPDKDMYFTRLLIDEIENENIDEVKWLLLHKNADPNLVLPKHGVSPMHVLAGFENECFSDEVIRIALEERGGDPNIRSADGLTPVHLAAIWGRCTVLETLLQFGGDPFLLEYKFSLDAEDLALKEHQWKTHAILATFSVFNTKHDPLDDYLLTGSLYKPSNETVECQNGLSKMTFAFNNSADKECLPDCEDSIIFKNIKPQDETECPRKDSTNLNSQSKPASSYEDTSNHNKPFEGEQLKKHDKMRRKKKLSDQFSESFTKLKKFFGQSSTRFSNSGNSPKVDKLLGHSPKRKTSKTSI